MTRPRTYKGALEELLHPLGYIRSGSEWLIRAGDVEECVYLQKSTIHGGVTVVA